MKTKRHGKKERLALANQLHANCEADLVYLCKDIADMLMQYGITLDGTGHADHINEAGNILASALDFASHTALENMYDMLNGEGDYSPEWKVAPAPEPKVVLPEVKLPADAAYADDGEQVVLVFAEQVEVLLAEGWTYRDKDTLVPPAKTTAIHVVMK